MPHKTHRLSFFPKAFSAAELRKFEGDRLYGVEVKIEVRVRNRGGTYTPLTDTPGPFYVYRYVEAADDNGTDALLKFNDTLNDGDLGITRERQVTYRGDASALPTMQAFGEFELRPVVTTTGQPSAFNISFDPTHDRDGISSEIHLATPGATPRQPGGPSHLTAVGDGIAPLTLYLNYDAYEAALAQLVVDASPVAISFRYNSAVLPRNIPFALHLVGHPDPNKTPDGALHLGATATDVDSALDSLLSAIDPDSVSVTLHREESPGPGGTKNILDIYVIRPQNAFASQATPDFEVLASPNPGFTVSILRGATRGLLTQNQRDQLGTRSLRSHFLCPDADRAGTHLPAIGVGYQLQRCGCHQPSAIRLGLGTDDSGSLR